MESHVRVGCWLSRLLTLSAWATLLVADGSSHVWAEETFGPQTNRSATSRLDREQQADFAELLSEESVYRMTRYEPSLVVFQEGVTADEDDSQPPETSNTVDNVEYGEAPVEYTSQLLRRQTPLLEPGQYQIDWGFEYTLNDFDFPGVVGAALVENTVRQRSFVSPFAVRYGWSERTQLFANLPVGFAHTEVANRFGEQTESEFGIGDLQFGFSHLISPATNYTPGLIGTFEASAPTGEEVIPFLTTDSGLGRGAWTLGTSLLLVHSYDPVIVFYGGGYRYSFEGNYGANRFQFGHEINYNLGVGFAANERVTLSTILLGSFITESQLDGVYLPNSEFEPVRLRFAATIARNCKIIEPFVEIGATDTAPSLSTGIVWTY